MSATIRLPGKSRNHPETSPQRGKPRQAVICEEMHFGSGPVHYKLPDRRVIETTMPDMMGRKP